MKTNCMLFFMCLFFLTTPNVSALADDDFTTVTLVPIKHNDSIFNGPHKSPNNNSCPVSLEYNWNNNSLLFMSNHGEVCTYCIYNVDEEPLSIGSLNFTLGNTMTVNLSDWNEDYYIIQVEVDGTLYEGVLEL